MNFKKYRLGDLVQIKYGKNQKDVISEEGTIPILGTGGIIGYATEALYDKPSVLIGRKGTIEKVRYMSIPFWTVDTLFYTIVNEDLVLPYFLYNVLLLIDLQKYNEGTTIPSLRTETLNKIELLIPDFETQKKIAKILSSLDDKIELNNRINKNLEEQAQAIFDDMFKGINNGDNYVGDIIIPKRGKNLLSKDAVKGDVPVVAGGLEPATYHNQSNTTAPVITISASGANAGYVNLWYKSVWASDSSYIDYTMTENVYFWYVLLKKRQREIYDAQTGSAQPHIYPQHIANLRIGFLDKNDVKNYVKIVAPLFMKIGQNQVQNNVLAQLRDTLLPKLMSGEIDVDKVEIL